MTEAMGRRRSGKNRRDPRNMEESAGEPMPNQAEGWSVDTGDSVNGEGLPTVGGAQDEEDPWLAVMQDFARLVIGAFEADPHRFDDNE